MGVLAAGVDGIRIQRSSCWHAVGRLSVRSLTLFTFMFTDCFVVTSGYNIYCISYLLSPIDYSRNSRTCALYYLQCTACWQYVVFSCSDYKLNAPTLAQAEHKYSNGTSQTSFSYSIHVSCDCERALPSGNCCSSSLMRRAGRRPSFQI